MFLCGLLMICRMANFEAIDFKGSGINQAKKESGLNEYVSSLFDPSLTWKDVDWIKTVTKLPVVIKGVLTGCVFLSVGHYYVCSTLCGDDPEG